MVYILSIMIFASIVALIFTIATQRADDVEARLRQLGYTVEGKIISQEEAALAKPFSERIFKPIVEKIASAVSRYTPAGQKLTLKRKLVSAGSPMSVNDFLARKGMYAIGFPIAICGLLILNKSSFTQIILFGVVVLVLGFLFPDLQIKSKIGARQKIIQKNLPDVLDLLCVSVEAGLGFDQALGKVVEKTKGPLAEEFNRTMQEVRMNKPRREALRDLADRVNLSDLSTFVSALIQADQLGVSIAKVLRIQSEQMRIKRRQRAEEHAQKASLKILFPLIFFIFPAMFIVLLGPAVLSMIEAQK